MSDKISKILLIILSLLPAGFSHEGEENGLDGIEENAAERASLFTFKTTYMLIAVILFLAISFVSVGIYYTRRERK